MNKLMKFAALILIICTPIIIVMLVFTPMATEKTEQVFKEQYRLSSDFTKNDIIRIIENMRKDHEFMYYFYILKPELLNTAILEVANEMEKYRDQEAIHNLIEQKKEKVSTLGSLLLNLEYPEDYYKNPQSFPSMNNLLWQFFAEEFKLSVVALCYKATYDPTFAFNWDDLTRRAARKFQAVAGRLSREQR
ncbi:MAG: hypothetical protein KC713_06155 [Candidatus Omnitrophica bacterium]|nr:hypothetical protein [Candidatus Omnitrophota bacterium]